MNRVIDVCATLDQVLDDVQVTVLDRGREGGTAVDDAVDVQRIVFGRPT